MWSLNSTCSNLTNCKVSLSFSTIQLPFSELAITSKGRTHLCVPLSFFWISVPHMLILLVALRCFHTHFFNRLSRFPSFSHLEGSPEKSHCHFQKQNYLRRPEQCAALIDVACFDLFCCAPGDFFLKTSIFLQSRKFFSYVLSSLILGQ